MRAANAKKYKKNRRSAQKKDTNNNSERTYGTLAYVYVYAILSSRRKRLPKLGTPTLSALYSRTWRA